ncbi:hypothetical protein [Azospirillum sp. Sh1]|uniref:hypothetical protein n=1 Tax=Azospirillum sp. Sh1 TaxID=2607285 RepID=UPI0011F00073|nr:hypothetical protein [Azospirillum sp. Sh1]KAA0574317.1 hypothetical protein FZ029_18845 [Azospirillum sp. Sh1]
MFFFFGGGIFDKKLDQLQADINTLARAQSNGYYVRKVIANENIFTAKLLEKMSNFLDGRDLNYRRIAATPVSGLTELNQPIRLRCEYAPSGESDSGVELTLRSTECGFIGSEENLSGADILMSYKVDGDVDDSVSKGLLAQAKIIEKLKDRREMERLKQQCSDMLRVTKDSYVFLYSPSGVTVIPAKDVIDGDWSIPKNTPSNVGAFMQSFLDCSNGDRSFQACTIPEFKKLLSETHVKHGLAIEIGDKPDPDPDPGPEPKKSPRPSRPKKKARVKMGQSENLRESELQEAESKSALKKIPLMLLR